MKFFLDIIKEIVKKENLFIEDRFFIDYTFLNFLIIKGYTFNIRITGDKTLIIYGENINSFHDIVELKLNERFKENFGKFVSKKKIELMYENRFEKWLSEFSIRLSENSIKCDKEKLKNELKNSFNISVVHEREIFLMKLMLNPQRNIYPYTIHNENIVIHTQEGEELGTIKIKEIEG